MKRILSLILAFMLAFSPAVFAAPAAAYEEEAVLASAGTLTPGENFLTGDTTYETLEGYEAGTLPKYLSSDTDADKSTWSIFEDENLGGRVGKNKSFKFIMNDGYPQIYFGVPNSLEVGRKYFLSFDLYTDATSGISNFWLMQSGSSENHVHSGFNSLLGGFTRGEWVSFDQTLTAITKNTMYIQMGIGEALKKNNYFYLDNVAFVPYYKVNYDGAEADYVLFANEDEKDLSKLASTYTIKTDNYPAWSGENAGSQRCIGWSRIPGAATPETSIQITGDVTLYPVWEIASAENAVKYTYESDKPGVANGTITVSLTEDTINYTSAEILLADDNGALTNYTPFGSFEFTDGTGTYTVSGNRVFPAEATKLAIRLIGEDLPSVYFWYTIPEEHRLVLDEEPKFSFWALSDLHLNGVDYNHDYWPEMPINRANAMADVMASDADFAFINGDLICYGDTNYLEVLQTYFDDKLNNPEFNVNNIPFFVASGNHEYYEAKVDKVNNEEVASYYNGQVDWLEENYGDEYSFVKNDGGWETWYAVDNDYLNMVFLQNPEPDESFEICEKQLRFLDNQLYKGEKSNKTNFVIIHRPLSGTIPSSNGGYVFGSPTTGEVMKILAKHPNTIVFSAHTHSDLGTDKAHNTVVNDMTTTPSHINDGSLVNTEIWGAGGTTYKDSSTGVYLEVYNDKIYVRSRRFAAESKYFGHGAYVIDIPDSSVKLHEVSMTGEMKDKAVFTAYVNGEIPADDAPYTYEWAIRNEIISTEKSFTLDMKGYYADEYVTLRVYDKDGNFASCISEEPFVGVKITYSLSDDATGDVPPSRTWILGAVMQPEIAVASPKKAGYFFKGWSTEKNASVPMKEVKITGETTFYPVFDTVPEFHFDANLSGFYPNSGVSEYSLADGMVNVKSNGGDMYFTWSNSSFPAETYKYMRIKAKYNSGYGDGMFYTTETSTGWSADKRIALESGKVVLDDNGMKVKEYDISSMTNFWAGTITKLRYDAIAITGDVDIDYVVFSSKLGIYKADITYNGEKATLSDESVNCSVSGTSAKDDVISITLTPADGYEFNCEFENLATINGVKATKTVINSDGTATVEFNPDDVPVTDTIIYIGNTEGTLDKYTVNMGAFENCTAVAAAYNADGRLVATGIAKDTNDVDGKLTVYVNRTLGASDVKVLIFEKTLSLKPVVEAKSANGNLFVNGDAEDASKPTAAYSDNATVTIVNDSEKGNVWNVVPKKAMDWVYFVQNVKYVPGKTYTATADVKILGTADSEDITALFHANARYLTDDFSLDHVVSNHSIKSGSWTKITCTFTVPENTTDRSKDQFTFYVDPVSDASVYYQVDNVDLRIVD